MSYKGKTLSVFTYFEHRIGVLFAIIIGSIVPIVVGIRIGTVKAQKF